ncbi:MAG: aminoglycoside phosphotransferase family protein [Planctomycetota bacterium]
MNDAGTSEAPGAAAVLRLCARAELPEPIGQARLEGGRNNRVYRLDFRDRSPALLKLYFRSPDDPRDRLGNEWAFSRFAWERGCRQVPEPLARDVEHRLGLYRFVEGRPLQSAEVATDHVEQAVRFVGELNRGVDPRTLDDLPTASEVCFGLAEHAALVESRVQRCAVDAGAAQGFVAQELIPRWRAVRSRLEDQAAQGLADVGPAAASPSDFGFHNAILRPDGRLVFHDFEYAGQDDAARIACDFFHQPRIPAPAERFHGFVQGLGAALGLGEAFAERCRALRPVYAVKWACIVLNPLTYAGAQRRGFAGVDHDPAELVERARLVLNRFAHEGG